MMKVLDYIQEISSSAEEFLAIIEEMNRWTGEKKNERRSIYVPYNNRQLKLLKRRVQTSP